MLTQLAQAVEKHKEQILAAQSAIWAQPETGYREEKTAQYLQAAFESLGYTVTTADGIPGFYTVMDTGRPGPEVLVLGELDALLCPEHPHANPQTGAAHCCGHSAQCAALLGIAAALTEPEVADALCGRIRLCAVPAEELIELEYRAALQAAETVRYFTGKREFLYRGYFDGVDMAMMVHTHQGNSMVCDRGAVGCTVKQVVYRGRSAHAGGNPWDGCNALYAATQGLSAVNAIRETFREEELIRVHPIITQGGTAVNAIPDEVAVEAYVRGSSFDAIHEANNRVNRALCGAALSLGAHVEITDTSGYAPLHNDKLWADIARQAAAVLPDIPFSYYDSVGSGSTDMGDLSCVMPVLHAYMPGASGLSHGADYAVDDAEKACVGSAKWQVAMLVLLLQNGAANAKAILQTAKPPFASKAAYFSYLETLSDAGERIAYGDGMATVRC